MALAPAVVTQLNGRQKSSLRLQSALISRPASELSARAPAGVSTNSHRASVMDGLSSHLTVLAEHPFADSRLYRKLKDYFNVSVTKSWPPPTKQIYPFSEQAQEGLASQRHLLGSMDSRETDRNAAKLELWLLAHKIMNWASAGFDATISAKDESIRQYGKFISVLYQAYLTAPWTGSFIAIEALKWLFDNPPVPNCECWAEVMAHEADELAAKSRSAVQLAARAIAAGLPTDEQMALVRLDPALFFHGNYTCMNIAQFRKVYRNVEAVDLKAEIDAVSFVPLSNMHVDLTGVTLRRRS